MKNRFRKAFAVELEETSGRNLEFVKTLSQKAKTHHLNVPLSIFLEGLRPFTRVTASLLTGLEPAAELFFPMKSYQELILFLEKRENLELLIEELKD